MHLDAHLEPEQLAALYRSCSVGVWPYRAEGFLMPALECMAAGTPTILPEMGPTADFSNHRTSFLTPAKRVQLDYRRRFRLRFGFEITVPGIDLVEVDVRSLRDTMRTAYESDRLTRTEKATAGLAMAHGRFTWSHSVDQVEESLVELMSSTKVAR